MSYEILKENLPLSIIKKTYNADKNYIYIKGYRVRTKNDKYLNFIEHGFKCAMCGIEGKYVNLERNKKRKFFKCLCC